MILTQTYVRVAAEPLDVLNQALQALSQRFGVAINPQDYGPNILIHLSREDSSIQKGLMAELSRVVSQHGYRLNLSEGNPTTLWLTPHNK